MQFVITAESAVMISNRNACRGLANEFNIPWFNVGNSEGKADEDRLIEICDQHEIDFIVLARYMQILSPASVWKYAGGPDHQSASWPIAQFSGHAALPRRFYRAHA